MVLFVLFSMLGLASAEICYYHTGVNSACCSEQNRFHRRCYGNQPIDVCKDWCDKNAGCLGYVGKGSNSCQVAIDSATQTCPSSFHLTDTTNTPNEGINYFATCGATVYTGCNIKVITTGSCAQVTTPKATTVTTTKQAIAAQPCPIGLLWATQHTCTFCSSGPWSTVSDQAECQTLAISQGRDHYTYKTKTKQCKIPTYNGGCTSFGRYANCDGNIHAQFKGCSAPAKPPVNTVTVGPVGPNCDAKAIKACELANREKCNPAGTSACGPCLPGFAKVSTACVDVSSCKDTSVLPSKAVFLLDMSGSVGSANFNKMKELTKDLVNVLPLQSFSFLSFSSSNKQVEYPGSGKFLDKAAALQEIPKITYQGGVTYTAKAIKLTQARLQDDLESANMVIVLTDGKASDSGQLKAEAKKLLETKDRNGTVTVISVGFGSIDKKELELIAGGEENTIIAEATGSTAGFAKLQSLIGTLVNNVCVNLPVDCTIEYGPYGPCDKTCGFSYQTREIVRLNLPRNGGKACPHGKALRAAVKGICDEPECPIDCDIKWGKWVCNGGKQSRQGKILDLAQFGGIPCPGEVGDTVTDTAQGCSACGNGERTEGEQCDDKNNENGDGCSEFCKIEEGYVCTGGGHSNPDKCAAEEFCKTKKVDCGGASVCVNGIGQYTCECADDYGFVSANQPCFKYFLGGDMGCGDCVDKLTTRDLELPQDPALPGWILTGKVQRAVAGNADFGDVLPPPGGDATMASLRKSGGEPGSISRGAKEIMVGHRYIVEWYEQSGTSDVYVDNTKVDNTVSTASDNGWTRRTAIFVATSTTPSIKIQTDSSTPVLVDSVVLKRDPTFTPTTTTTTTTTSTTTTSTTTTTQPVSSSNPNVGDGTPKANDDEEETVNEVNDDDGAHTFTFAMSALVFGSALAFLLQG